MLNRIQHSWSDRLLPGSLIGFTAVTFGAFAAIDYRIMLALVGILGVGFLVLGSDSDWLLISGLLMVFLVPLGYVGVPGVFGRYFTPGVIFFALWVARVVCEGYRKQRIGFGAPVCILLVLALAISWSASIQATSSFRWISVVVICVMAPFCIGFDSGSGRLWKRLEVVFAMAGLVIGAAAVVELMFRWNPWYLVYSSQDLARSWSVFRAKSTMGHPLSTMMASSTCFAVTMYARRRFSPAFLVSSLMSIIAVLLTVSRTGVFALGAGVIAGTAVALAGRDRFSKRTSLLVAGVALVAISVLALSPLLETRSSSNEGVDSAEVRDSIASYAGDLFAQRPLFGWGPGVSADLFYSQTGVILENSGLQITVSVGFVGAALFAILVVIVVVGGALRRQAGAVAGVAAFLIAIGGFNALDTSPGFLVIFGVLIVGCRTGARLPRD